MQQALSFLLLAFFALSALSAPLAPRSALAKRNHFQVSVKGRPKLPPAQAINAAYRKYGLEVTEVNSAPTSNAIAESNASKSSSSTSSSGSSTSAGSPPGSADEGDVTANLEDQGSEYLSAVTIGGQQLNLQLDTGSADLWVYTPGLRSGGGGSFDESKSSTWSDLQGATWQTLYGDGTGAKGKVGFDTVNIGGVEVEKQCVELALNASAKLRADTYSDGIVGLGFTALNQVSPQPQKTFFENVEGQLEQPVFTADLTDNGGEYEFGTIDSSKYSGDIHYASVDNTLGYWQIDSPSFAVGGKTQQCQTCSPAVIDTGTTLILVDSDVAKAYYAEVQGASVDHSIGGYSYPCDAQLPDFGVAIGKGYTATIKGSDVTYMPNGDGSNTCYGGIQPGPGNLQIYGDVLLRSAFVVFDIGNTQVGFAQK